MNRIKNSFQTEFIINKSRFIALLLPLNSKEEVKPFLSQISKDYPKATHYCYAYVVDGLNKSNDDGEPSGTAGRPILEVLLKQNLTQVLCVVVRYFGGIKLGAGGLTRAYVEGATSVINVSEIYHEEIMKIYQINVNYSNGEIIKNYFIKEKIEINDIIYDEDIAYIISSPNLDEDKLKDFMQGNVKITYLEQKEVLVKNI